MNRIPPPVRNLLARILFFLLLCGGTAAAIDAALEPDLEALAAALLLFALLAAPMLRRPTEQVAPARVTRR